MIYLGGCKSGAVQNKFVGRRIKCNRGFEALYVGSMSKFCLGTAPNDSHLVGKCKPFLLLFFCSLTLYCRYEQTLCKTTSAHPDYTI